MIQMCVYFQEQQKKSDLPNNLNFESYASKFVRTWKHHEAVLLLSNVELLIQTFSPLLLLALHLVQLHHSLARRSWSVSPSPAFS